MKRLTIRKLKISINVLAPSFSKHTDWNIWIIFIEVVKKNPLFSYYIHDVPNTNYIIVDVFFWVFFRVNEKKKVFK